MVSAEFKGMSSKSEIRGMLRPQLLLGFLTRILNIYMKKFAF